MLPLAILQFRAARGTLVCGRSLGLCRPSAPCSAGVNSASPPRRLKPVQLCVGHWGRRSSSPQSLCDPGAQPPSSGSFWGLRLLLRTEG